MRTCLICIFVLANLLLALTSRHVINLNGTWDFEQTEIAFPPGDFTRKIPVPGLITLARPKIDQYDKMVAKSKVAEYKTTHAYTDMMYEPRYNWYKKEIEIPADLQDSHAVLTILKSKYVTQVFVNGMDVGGSISCYTPIDVPVTSAIKWGEKNEILIRVGDRAWLPSSAAGSTDKEKVNYLPGIWDDVSLSFTGPYRVHRAMFLPDAEQEKVTAKLLIRNFHLPQQHYGDPMQDTCIVNISVQEKQSGKETTSVSVPAVVERDNLTKIVTDISIPEPNLWSPEDPFLYHASVSIHDQSGAVSDEVTETFGMRDFERRGNVFYLNGERCTLLGTNVTLHRFFEDPDCQDLPWNHQWVTRLLSHYPQQLNWNAMRVCVGIAPDFWYDIADSVGLMLQNEWLYWQDHGWDEQIRKEYTDWVWADGSHPSIVIWDAINENWNDYVGSTLIPELKKLDPTRIWDAGYMSSEQMSLDEMDEPHPYMQPGWRENFAEWAEQNPYPLGDLFYWPERWHKQFESSAAQLVNEYGWVWLWRNGMPSHLTKGVYEYYLGEQTTPQQHWDMQAYWLQCQTEWLRVNRKLAGILAFCYLSDNLGFTGDWWVGDVSELNPSPALHWFQHCFAPSAVFIDVQDQRYLKTGTFFEPGAELAFNCVGVTEELHSVPGALEVQLRNSSGDIVWNENRTVSLRPYENTIFPVCLALPEKTGCYTIIAEFKERGKEPVISRRFIQIGEKNAPEFWSPEPGDLK